jgi:hypothetical protein
VHTNLFQWFRIGQDILDLENEVKELKRHVSTQENLVLELRNGVCIEALINETCNVVSPEPAYQDDGSLSSNSNPGEDSAPNKLDTHIDSLSEVLDALLTEHKVDGALAILEEEEKAFTEFEKTEDPSSPNCSPILAIVSRLILCIIVVNIYKKKNISHIT